MSDVWKLVLVKKTGFINLSPAFTIYDFRKKIFYSDKFTNSKKFKAFNLPEGIYYVIGELKQLVSPVKFAKLKLPKPERNLPFKVDTFKIIFSDNPNKCTISYTNKTITFDNKLKNKPLFSIYFILYHEYGHKYYGSGKSEKFCDLYAANKMLDKGFNPSQIMAAPIISLSYNKIRKAQMININANSNSFKSTL